MDPVQYAASLLIAEFLDERILGAYPDAREPAVQLRHLVGDFLRSKGVPADGEVAETLYQLMVRDTLINAGFIEVPEPTDASTSMESATSIHPSAISVGGLLQSPTSSPDSLQATNISPLFFNQNTGNTTPISSIPSHGSLTSQGSTEESRAESQESFDYSQGSFDQIHASYDQSQEGTLEEDEEDWESESEDEDVPFCLAYEQLPPFHYLNVSQMRPRIYNEVLEFFEFESEWDDAFREDITPDYSPSNSYAGTSPFTDISDDASSCATSVSECDEEMEIEYEDEDEDEEEEEEE